MQCEVAICCCNLLLLSAVCCLLFAVCCCCLLSAVDVAGFVSLCVVEIMEAIVAKYVLLSLFILSCVVVGGWRF